MLTNVDLENKFDEYNKQFFDGQLSKVKIEFNGRIKRCMGYYMPTENRIAISKVFLKGIYSDDAIWDTLVHEMIHVYQYQVLKIPGDHRSTFKAKMRQINSQSGMHIATRFDPSLYAVAKNTETGKTQYLYYRLKINRTVSRIQQVEKTQIKRFSRTQRYYRVPENVSVPNTQSFKAWKRFLEHDCIPVERRGNVISKLSCGTHNMYLLHDILGNC